MRRYIAKPFGSSITAARCLSLLVLLALIGVIYVRVREPASWSWLDPIRPADAQEPAEIMTVENPERIVPGPTDHDEESQRELQLHLRYVADRAPLRSREMPAYWLLMAWARAQALRDLERRAQPEPAVSQLWEKPSDFRGRPIRLKLHVRRILRYDAPRNPLGLNEAYEIWGWTDNSRSFPYVAVVPELPAGLSVGTDMQGEAVFTGYFLKIMSYSAFDNPRGAPLLVGRLRAVERNPASPVRSTPTRSPELWLLPLGIGVLIAASVLYTRFVRKADPRPSVRALPDNIILDLIPGNSRAD